MKTNVYIIRHTETVGNIEKRLTGRMDYDITEKGYELIKKLEENLREIKFDVAYSSTEMRSYNTIAGLAKMNNINITKTSQLSEMYFGEFDGFTWDEVNKINPNIKIVQNKINSIEGIKNQESMTEVAERMYFEVLKICRENCGKNILIGSHGVAIEAFLRKITGVPFNLEREKYCQHNTSINKLKFENDIFEIEILADKKFEK